MEDWQARLEVIFKSFDERTEGFADWDLLGPLNGLVELLKPTGSIPVELAAEVMAFSFSQDHPNQSDGWGLYYGPMHSSRLQDGTVHEFPSLSQVTSEVIGHWSRRAYQAKHPVLQARYADLVWELGQKVKGTSRDPNIARRMIDAVVEIARRYPTRSEAGRQLEDLPEIEVIRKLQRAMQVALALRDEPRVEILRDEILAYEDRTAADLSPGLWGYSFDLFIEGKKKIPLSDTQRDKIIADLEARLTRLIEVKEVADLDPHAIQGATLRLAPYYRCVGRTGDVSRVLDHHTNAFLRKAEGAAGLVAASWLREVHEILLSFNLKKEAEAVLTRYTEFARKSRDEMHPISVSTSLPVEEVEAYFRERTEGNLNELLVRFACEHLPRREDAERQVRENARQHVLSSLISTTVVDHDGRAVAQIGPVEDDLEGNIIHHVSRSMGYQPWFLRQLVERLVTNHGLDAERTLAFVYQSPVFNPCNRTIVAEGLRAYFNQNWLVATHLLVPQIEDTVRRLVRMNGGVAVKRGRKGAMMLINLNDLLEDEKVIGALPPYGAQYLRILLTDQRGWNVRNVVCHGIMPAEQFSSAVADRIFHAILLLGLLRDAEVTESTEQEPAVSQEVKPVTEASPATI